MDQTALQGSLMGKIRGFILYIYTCFYVGCLLFCYFAYSFNYCIILYYYFPENYVNVLINPLTPIGLSRDLHI